MKSRSSLKIGHVRSKPRSLGQIIEKKACVHSKGLSFDPKFMKLCQNVDPIKSSSGLQLGHAGSKLGH